MRQLKKYFRAKKNHFVLKKEPAYVRIRWSTTSYTKYELRVGRFHVLFKAYQRFKALFEVFSPTRIIRKRDFPNESSNLFRTILERFVQTTSLRFPNAEV